MSLTRTQASNHGEDAGVDERGMGIPFEGYDGSGQRIEEGE
jgi:hypothetical protein